MVSSKVQWSLLGAALLIVAALTAWLLLKREPRENFVIKTSLTPDTYIATRIDETPEQQPATPAVRQNGYGVITYPDGSIYMGNFVDGEESGKGKITYPGGASYEGEFSEGVPHGKGVCTYSSGKTENCDFILGERQ